MALVGGCDSFKVKVCVKPDNSWPTVLIYCLTRFTIGTTEEEYYRFTLFVTGLADILALCTVVSSF